MQIHVMVDSIPRGRHGPWWLVVLSVILPVVFTACEREQGMTVIEEGIPLSLAESRKATLSDIRYRFSLDVPAVRSEPVVGTVELRFRWRDPASGPVVLDLKSPGDRVRSIRINDSEVEPAYEADHVLLPPGALHADAQNRVLIASSCTPCSCLTAPTSVCRFSTSPT